MIFLCTSDHGWGGHHLMGSAVQGEVSNAMASAATVCGAREGLRRLMCANGGLRSQRMLPPLIA
jgi:hypothetical protein